MTPRGRYQLARSSPYAADGGAAQRRVHRAADARVASPLLPAIARDFHVGIGTAGLTVASYSLTYALGQIFYGPLGDRVGRVQVIRVRLVVFALSSMLCATAPSFSALLALRLITGLAAAAVIPSSLAYLGDTVSDQAARQRRSESFSPRSSPARCWDRRSAECSPRCSAGA